MDQKLVHVDGYESVWSGFSYTFTAKGILNMFYNATAESLDFTTK